MSRNSELGGRRPRPLELDRDDRFHPPRAIGEDDDDVGEEDRLVQIVGDEQHGALIALPHRQKQRLQQQAGLAVERAERLVHQQDIRLDGKGAGERAVRRTPTPRPSGRAYQRTGRARGVMFALLPILLQKSKVAGRLIFREITKREAIADSNGRTHISEVACEFNVGR
jgi:hypothetical protein